MDRNERIDFYKGFLIFGVIWGHMITNLLAGEENSIRIGLILRTYDMPMFMLLSGYFLSFSMSKNSWQSLMKNRFLRVLVPAVFWSLLMMHGKLFKIFECLYFLYAVFFCTLIVTTIGKIITSIKVQIFLFLLISIALNIVPFSLWNLSYLFPFFASGYIINNLKVQRCYMGGAFLLWVACLCFWTIDYSIWTTGTFITSFDYYHIAVVIFRYLIAVLGIASAAKMCDVLYYYCKNNSEQKNFLFLTIIRAGKETLLLYILQEIILFKLLRHGMEYCINQFGFNPLILNILFLGYFIAPLCTFLLIVILLYVADFVKKYKLSRLLFGYYKPSK